MMQHQNKKHALSLQYYQGETVMNWKLGMSPYVNTSQVCNSLLVLMTNAKTKRDFRPQIQLLTSRQDLLEYARN